MIKKAVALIAAVIISITLLGCKDSVKKYDANISELRTNLYAAENSDMKVSAITGRRENPYVLDGTSDEKIDFTVITIVPTNFLASKKYTYKAVINNVEYKGDFMPHPFAPSLSADIQAQTNSNNIALTVICDGAEQSLALTSMLNEGAISADKALTIAISKLKTQLKDFESKGKLNAEIYVRLTENPIDNTGGYFWYVAFVGEAQKTYAVLLNCLTGDVCAIAD